MYYNDFEFKSSYLILPDNSSQKGLSGYDSISIGNFILHYSDEMNIVEAANNNSKIIMMGYCLDIRDASLSEHDILERLLASDDIVENLEYINGRYFLILNHEGRTEVFSDASQLRPLVYHEQSKSLCSHDELLKSYLEYQGYEFTRRPFLNHTELDFTRYENIYKFNPSLVLNLDSFEFKRIYPRKNLDYRSAKDTFEEVVPFLDESISWLQKSSQQLLLTVTAGIDSRVSAALSRTMSTRIDYLTYTKPQEMISTNLAKKIYRIDEVIANQLRDNMGWNHSIIDLSEYPISDEEVNKYDKVYNSKHSYLLANYYRNFKKYNNTLHVKSTVFGMGKADFPKRLDEHEDTFSFYKECIHGLSDNFLKYYDVDKEIKEYFNRNKVEEGVSKGRHYFDLFHLESRMGNWHSMLTLETDPETDEFIFTNARKIIDLIQQPSILERRQHKLYKLIINHYWPVLLHFGINSRKNLGEVHMDSLEKEEITLSEILVTEESNTEVTEVGQGIVEVQPDENEVFAHKNYTFTMENLGEEEKLVVLKGLYTNPKGRDRIKVTIRSEEKYEIHDILDMSEGIVLNVSENIVSVTINYDRNYKKKSWKTAGRIRISMK